MIALLLACSHEVTLSAEVTVPGALLEDLADDLVYPHRVILGYDVPGTLNNQLSLGEICAAQSDDIVLTHTVTRTGCAQSGTVIAWLEPAGTDADCLLEAGTWEPLTEPPQGAPQASTIIFDDGSDCRTGAAEAWLTLGYGEGG